MRTGKSPFLLERVMIMGKGKNIGEELSGMLRGVPPQNILIAFDDKPAKSLADHVKEQKEKSTPKKHGPRRDRER